MDIFYVDVLEINETFPIFIPLIHSTINTNYTSHAHIQILSMFTEQAWHWNKSLLSSSWPTT
jgi:hypothetical protein